MRNINSMVKIIAGSEITGSFFDLRNDIVSVFGKNSSPTAEEVYFVFQMSVFFGCLQRGSPQTRAWLALEILVFLEFSFCDVITYKLWFYKLWRIFLRMSNKTSFSKYISNVELTKSAMCNSVRQGFYVSFFRSFTIYSSDIFFPKYLDGSLLHFNFLRGRYVVPCPGRVVVSDITHKDNLFIWFSFDLCTHKYLYACSNFGPFTVNRFLSVLDSMLFDEMSFFQTDQSDIFISQPVRDFLYIKKVRHSVAEFGCRDNLIAERECKKIWVAFKKFSLGVSSDYSLSSDGLYKPFLCMSNIINYLNNLESVQLFDITCSSNDLELALRFCPIIGISSAEPGTEKAKLISIFKQISLFRYYIHNCEKLLFTYFFPNKSLLEEHCINARLYNTEDKAKLLIELERSKFVFLHSLSDFVKIKSDSLNENDLSTFVEKYIVYSNITNPFLITSIRFTYEYSHFLGSSYVLSDFSPPVLKLSQCRKIINKYFRKGLGLYFISFDSSFLVKQITSFPLVLNVDQVFSNKNTICLFNSLNFEIYVFPLIFCFFLSSFQLSSSFSSIRCIAQILLFLFGFPFFVLKYISFHDLEVFLESNILVVNKNSNISFTFSSSKYQIPFRNMIKNHFLFLRSKVSSNSDPKNIFLFKNVSMDHLNYSLSNYCSQFNIKLDFTFYRRRMIKILMVKSTISDVYFFRDYTCLRSSICTFPFNIIQRLEYLYNIVFNISG